MYVGAVGRLLAARVCSDNLLHSRLTHVYSKSHPLNKTVLMSGLDGSGAVHTVLPWEALGGHVPPGAHTCTGLSSNTSILGDI